MLDASSVTVSKMPLPTYVEPRPDWYGAGFAGDMVFASQEGPMPAAWLRPGDLVQTRDNGMQPLVMMERQERRSDLMMQSAEIAHGTPLPASQRALVSGWKLELHFGHDEMLVALGAMNCARPFASPMDQPFYILAFEDPQLIHAAGLWLEASCMASEQPARPHMTGVEARTIGLGIEDLID